MNLPRFLAQRAEVRQLTLCILLGAFAGGMASPAFAQKISCTFDTMLNTSYVPPAVDLKVDDFGRVLVADNIIAATGNRAVVGKVETDNAKRTTIVWIVQNVKKHPNDYGTAFGNLKMRLTIQKSSGSAVLNVLAGFRSNNRATFRVEGSCDTTS